MKNTKGPKKRGPKKGFKHSEATKAKMSKTRQAKNFKHSEEYKLAKSKEMRGSKNPSYKPFEVVATLPSGVVKTYVFKGSRIYPSPILQAKAKNAITPTFIYKCRDYDSYTIKSRSKVSRKNGWSLGTIVTINYL